MFKKVYACLSLSLVLATAAPALSPALPALAYARVSDQQSASANAGLASGKFTTENGKTYCKNDDGSNKTGWVKESGNWYYFDRQEGYMRTGWIKDNNKWYYLYSTDGHMATGWLILNPSGRKYYFNKNGSMVQGPGWATIDGNKYYFTAYGHVKNAWELVSGKWYYRTTDGTAVKNRWILYNGQYYYLTADGSAAVGTVKVDGREYKFNSTCALTGTAPSSVMVAAKEPLTSSTLKSAAANTDTEVKTADPAKTESTSSTKTSSDDTAKTEAEAATAAAITSVVGKLNDVTESRKQFVIQIANYVRKYAPQYGIKVYSPIIAQAIHESGWGESSLSAKYHNYFGLKCGTLWTGKSVNLSTKEEYTAGTLTTIKSNFRVYDTMEEGVKGYFEFIQLSRYSNLKGVTSPRQYLQNIKNDGYATGSQYVDHTMALINLYNLTQFDN